MDKQELRRHYLSLRAAVADRAGKDAAIVEAIRNLDCCCQAAALALYASDGKEPDLRSLFGWKRTFLPRYSEMEKRYELVEIHDPETDLVPGRYGLWEPRAELPAAPEEFVRREVVFLTPAVACTRRGVRLGRGGGFYDRLLDGIERAAVGVIYSCQLAEELPEEPHDRRLDRVVCESGAMECNRKL